MDQGTSGRRDRLRDKIQMGTNKTGITKTGITKMGTNKMTITNMDTNRRMAVPFNDRTTAFAIFVAPMAISKWNAINEKNG